MTGIQRLVELQVAVLLRIWGVIVGKFTKMECGSLLHLQYSQFTKLIFSSITSPNGLFIFIRDRKTCWRIFALSYMATRSHQLKSTLVWEKVIWLNISRTWAMKNVKTEYWPLYCWETFSESRTLLGQFTEWEMTQHQKSKGPEDTRKSWNVSMRILSRRLICYSTRVH